MDELIPTQPKDLVYLVNTSNGQLIFDKLSLLVPKNSVYPKAFDYTSLIQDTEFSKFYNKGMVKLVRDPSRVQGATRPALAPKVEDTIVIKSSTVNKESSTVPTSPKRSSETFNRPQLDELNQRVRSGEPLTNLIIDNNTPGNEGTSRDESKPSIAKEERNMEEELRIKIIKATSDLNRLILEEEELRGSAPVSVPPPVQIEKEVILPKTASMKADAAVTLRQNNGDLPGRAASIGERSPGDDEDMPLAVVPPITEKAKDTLERAEKDPAWFKMSVAKSKDTGLLRELLYGTRDKTLRHYVHNRLTKIEKEMDDVE